MYYGQINDFGLLTLDIKISFLHIIYFFFLKSRYNSRIIALTTVLAYKVVSLPVRVEATLGDLTSVHNFSSFQYTDTRISEQEYNQVITSVRGITHRASARHREGDGFDARSKPRHC